MLHFCFCLKMIAIELDQPLFEVNIHTQPVGRQHVERQMNIDKLVDTALAHEEEMKSKNICAYCRREKKKYCLLAKPYEGSVYGSTKGSEHILKFCDFICAKLFYDNFNRITIDITDYKRAYNQNLLDKKARTIYERVGNNYFAFLPTYKVKDNNWVEHRHKLERLI